MGAGAAVGMTADVATWSRKLQDGGLARGTAVAARATFSAVMQAAVDDGLLSRNPVTGLITQQTLQTSRVQPTTMSTGASHQY